MRRAAVDIGTNSVRLLIVDDDGSDIVRKEVVTGLGRGVDRGRRLDPEAVSRTVATLSEYGREIRENSVEMRRAIATSAARDAGDSAAFLDVASEALGFRPEVITGFEEAALALEGAASGFPAGTTLVVVDIGGGSTEFVRRGSAVSIDIGSVRLTERHLGERPVGFGQLERAVDECRGLFAQVEPAECTVVGVAGTWTSLAALDSGPGRPGGVHHHRLDRTPVDRLVLRLASLSVAETAALPGLDAARAPVILGGAVVAREAMRALGANSVVVSERDSLDGVVSRLGA